jgi:hypothetical protein
MSDERGLAARFSAYRSDLSDDVRAPGVEAVHRTVLRRQKRRNTVASALAVLAIGAGVVQFALAGGPQTGPAGPTSQSPSVSASPESSVPSASPSSASPSSASPSGTPSSSRPPSTPPPAEQVPAPRSYPVVDGYEIHVVALAEVRLEPVDGVYRGIVYVDVYNSGRQASSSNSVYLTEPPGVRWDSTAGSSSIMGGCVGTAPPETWVCPAEGVPAAGGYQRMPVHVRVNTAPGATTRTIDGFAVRVMGRDQAGPVDATPADNKVTVRLILPPA